MDEVKFIVFGNPVPKARARTVTEVDKNGKKKTRSYTPEETAIHEQNIAWVYKSVYHGFKFPEDVPLRLSCDFYFEMPKTRYRQKPVTKKMREDMLAGIVRPMNKRDPDNLLKTVADAGNHVIYDDDEQIVEMQARKFFSDKPRTEIFIARIDNEK